MVELFCHGFCHDKKICIHYSLIVHQSLDKDTNLRDWSASLPESTGVPIRPNRADGNICRIIIETLIRVHVFDIPKVLVWSCRSAWVQDSQKIRKRETDQELEGQVNSQSWKWDFFQICLNCVLLTGCLDEQPQR